MVEFDIEKWPQKIIDSCDNIVIACCGGKIKWVNKKFKEVTGISKKEIIGRLAENVMGRDFNMIKIKEITFIKISSREIPTCFGSVFIASKTNGLEEEYKKFNDLFNGNKEKLGRMQLLWQKTK